MLYYDYIKNKGSLNKLEENGKNFNNMAHHNPTSTKKLVLPSRTSCNPLTDNHHLHDPQLQQQQHPNIYSGPRLHRDGDGPLDPIEWAAKRPENPDRVHP